MSKTELTAERLRELLNHDPKTGVFTRQARACATAPAGCIAGTVKRNGYIYIGADGGSYLAHRLAWLYSTGAWPAGVIDHINGSRGDNRIANLRDVTVAENSQNLRAGHKDSASKFLGVSRKRGRWRANIYSGGRHISLGGYEPQEDASAAYLAAKRIYHARAMSAH